MKLSLNGSIYNIYEQEGAGPALIFLHYFGGSSREWRGTFSKLNGYARLIAPDLRGFGESAASTTRYRLGNFADDIAALVSALNLKQYSLVGHGMGGKIALALAARRPTELTSLILFAPSPPLPSPSSEEERGRLIADYGSRKAALESIQKMSARQVAAVELKVALEDYLRSSHTAWRGWLEQGGAEDISIMMPYINVPTLIVAGAEDSVVPINILKREVEQGIATARMVVVPGVGHLIPLEAPQVVASMVRIMLSGGFEKLT